jgi:hypothetical protein
MSPWFAVMPAWLPWALAALAASVAGWLVGFWCGTRDRADECQFLRMRLAESDGQVRQLLVDGANRARVFVERLGGHDDAA